MNKKIKLNYWVTVEKTLNKYKAIYAGKVIDSAVSESKLKDNLPEAIFDFMMNDIMGKQKFYGKPEEKGGGLVVLPLDFAVKLEIKYIIVESGVKQKAIANAIGKFPIIISNLAKSKGNCNVQLYSDVLGYCGYRLRLSPILEDAGAESFFSFEVYERNNKYMVKCLDYEGINVEATTRREAFDLAMEGVFETISTNKGNDGVWPKKNIIPKAMQQETVERRLRLDLQLKLYIKGSLDKNKMPELTLSKRLGVSRQSVNVALSTQRNMNFRSFTRMIKAINQCSDADLEGLIEICRDSSWSFD